jgi:hypothetical protein
MPLVVVFRVSRLDCNLPPVQVLDSPNREAVEAVVVVRGIDTATIEVQVVTVRRGME